MALTGLQIQKLLPGTNCRECGSNTCMAFAMKLASKKAEIAQCPYASDEAKQVLGEAYEPPVKGIALGRDGSLKTGEETVLYRHEKTFVNGTLLAINCNDTDESATVDRTLGEVKNYLYERVGERLGIDLVSVTQLGSDEGRFLSLVKKAASATGKPLVVRSESAAALAKAAALLKGNRSIFYAATPALAEAVIPAARENGHAVAFSGPDPDAIIEAAQRFRDAGFVDLLVDTGAQTLAEQFQVSSIARRGAIKGAFKPLGFPCIRFMSGGSLVEDTVSAVTDILKYGGVVILPAFEPAQLAALLTLRLNIFTDPQKPIQVEPKIYAIGEPGAASPIFVTTNFSLTYFVVSGEIENSGTSAWLVVPECEGMSVLTAWAAGKFNAATIASFVKAQKLEELVTTRELVIPGYISQISGELEDLLPGWKAVIGPQEAGDLESFIKLRCAG